VEPPPLLELGTELRQGRIGLLADQLAHQGQSRAITAGLPAASVGPWGDLAGGPTPVQQLLQTRLAHAEQGGQSAL